MKSDLQAILSYYKSCIHEEVKSSAFKNIKADKLNVYLPFESGLLYDEEFAGSLTELPGELTEIQIKKKLDPTRELVYGFLFIHDKIRNKEINTPLLYIPIEISREYGSPTIHLTSNEFSFNVGALSEYLSQESAVYVVEEILKQIPQIPITEEAVYNFKKTIENFIPDIKIKDEEGVIFANLPKVTAGMLKDMKEIIENTDEVKKTSLNSLNYNNPHEQAKYGPDSSLVRANSITLDESQLEVLKAVNRSQTVAVIGGPGCGKSRTISSLATHLVSHGKSVLIASKMAGAVDVVYNKLRDQQVVDTRPYQYIVRTGNKESRQELAKLFEEVALMPERPYGHYEYKSILDLTNQYRINASYNPLYGDYNNLNYELRTTNKFLHPVKYAKLKSQYKNISAEYEYVKELYRGKDSMDDLRKVVFFSRTRRLVERATRPEARRFFLLLAKTLKSAQPNIQILAENFSTILEYIPVWCTTINDVSSTIPNIAGLFDVVIIDEASQCDIASVIPLLYRAKKAVIVGDNKQLKYLSFLDNKKNVAFKEINEVPAYMRDTLDYRNNSLFDYALLTTNTQPVMLKNYYRSSYKSLIEFSSKEFYNNQIHVANVVTGDSSYGHLVFTYITSDIPKSDKAVNPVEAELIVKEIVSRVKDERKEGDMYTMGVVTPFRAQADLIRRKLEEQLTLKEIEDFKIRVGTAHAFQGDERDVMFASWVVSGNSPYQSFTFINNPNLFNVAITRAKKYMYNYVSVTASKMPDCLLRRYCESSNETAMYIGDN